MKRNHEYDASAAAHKRPRAGDASAMPHHLAHPHQRGVPPVVVGGAPPRVIVAGPAMPMGVPHVGAGASMGRHHASAAPYAQAVSYHPPTTGYRSSPHSSYYGGGSRTAPPPSRGATTMTSAERGAWGKQFNHQRVSSKPTKPTTGITRTAGGETWKDPTLSDWDENDFRIFCGDLGNEVNDEVLRNAFCQYKSLLKVRVIRDKRTQKSKGYGFISFSDPHDFVAALREMNGKYVGNRPIKLRKSNWEDRNKKTSKARGGKKGKRKETKKKTKRQKPKNSVNL